MTSIPFSALFDWLKNEEDEEEEKKKVACTQTHYAKMEKKKFKLSHISESKLMK